MRIPPNELSLKIQLVILRQCTLDSAGVSADDCSPSPPGGGGGGGGGGGPPGTSNGPEYIAPPEFSIKIQLVIVGPGKLKTTGVSADDCSPSASGGGGGGGNGPGGGGEGGSRRLFGPQYIPPP